jgi:phosphoadenosine phosphosulfate reductase
MSLLKITLENLQKGFDQFTKEGRRVFATSSFQTQSVPLLHIISENFPKTPILFIDTGFLFPETYVFKDKLQKDLDLQVISLNSQIALNQQQDPNTGFFQYAIDTDKCCNINKVAPLESYKKNGDVWISGVRRDQTSVRNEMELFEYSSNDIIKFHPMLEWTSRDIYQYIALHNLPKHPLENEGYHSIGCEPCTHKITIEENRGGRWVGRNKTECGLHFNKK